MALSRAFFGKANRIFADGIGFGLSILTFVAGFKVAGLLFEATRVAVDTFEWSLVALAVSGLLIFCKSVLFAGFGLAAAKYDCLIVC